MVKDSGLEFPLDNDKARGGVELGVVFAENEVEHGTTTLVACC
jgi:hypothetical protein